MSLAFPPPKRNQRRPRRLSLAVTEASSFSSSSSFQKSSAHENKTIISKITSKLSGIISLVREKMTNILDSDEEEKPHSKITAPECLRVSQNSATTLSTPSFGHNSGEVDQLPIIDAELKEHLTPQKIRECDETEKISKGSKVLETQNSISVFDRSWTTTSEIDLNSPKDNSFQTAATSKKDSENETSMNSSHSSRSSVKLVDVINFLSKVHENTQKGILEFIPRSQKKSDPLLQKIIKRPRAIRFIEDLISQKSDLKSKKRDRTEFGAYMCASIQKKNKEDLIKHVLKKSKLTTSLTNYNTKLITVRLQKASSPDKDLLKIKNL